MLGRLVAGFGVGALSLLVPMYQAETAPRHIRGALISTYQLMITFGIFLAAVFNYAAERHQSGKAASWQITLGLSFVFAVILGAGMLFFAETPRFDYRRGKHDRAKATMMKVYGVPENHYSLHMELEEIRLKLEAESVRGNPVREWLDMWKAPKMAYRLILGMGLQMFQQLTGVSCAAHSPIRKNCFMISNSSRRLIIFSITGPLFSLELASATPSSLK